MSDKISKEVALYLPARYVPTTGCTCDRCRDFIRLSSECVITIPPNVRPGGVCTLFVTGKPHEYGTPLQLIPQNVVSYTDEGKTYCGRCKYYEKLGRPVSPCSKVEGLVEFGGCCNAFESRD